MYEQGTVVVAWYSFLPKDTGMNQPVVLTLRRSIQETDLYCFELTTYADCLKYRGSREEMKERFLLALRRHKEIVDAPIHRKPDLIFRVEQERSIEAAMQIDQDDGGISVSENAILASTRSHKTTIAAVGKPRFLKRGRS
jgi:hypothetical protein